MKINYYISRLNKSLTTTLILSILTATGIATGIAPKLSLQSGELLFSNTILAQNFAESLLRNYAQIVKVNEPNRQRAMNEIERILGQGAAAQLACHKPDTIKKLRDESARKIARDFCKTSAQIVKQYGLTPQQFNQITRAVQNNAALRQQVQKFLR